MDYRISSRAYLRRARDRLNETSPESLFYAAFELRCGIEARMHEYLDAQDHIAKSKKKGWRILKLGRNLEKAFKSGDRIAEITVIMPPNTGKPGIRLYYTPVTSSLRKMGQKVGVLLHAMRKYRRQNDQWWQETRLFLERVYQDAEKANKGTLLGPPLIHSATARVTLNAEAIDGQDPNKLLKQFGRKGMQAIIKVNYLDTFPETT